MFANMNQELLISILIDLAINLMLYWILFKIGVLQIKHKNSDGILRIDRSDPEKDIYRFDIADLDNLVHKKHVTLKIDNDAHLSGKSRD